MYLRSVVHLLDNPLYIVSCRNPFDSVLSKMNRTGGGEFNAIYQGLCKQYVKTLDIMESLDCNCIFLNYSEATAAPALFASLIADFLKIEKSGQLINDVIDFCKPGSYKVINQVPSEV